MSEPLPIVANPLSEEALEWKLLAEDFADRIEAALDGIPGLTVRRVYTPPPYELGKVHPTLRLAEAKVPVWPCLAFDVDGVQATMEKLDLRLPSLGIYITDRGLHTKGGKICAYIVQDRARRRGLLTNPTLIRERTLELLDKVRQGKQLLKRRDLANEGARLIKFPGFHSEIRNHRNGYTVIEGASIHEENEENVVLWQFLMFEPQGKRLRIRDLKGPMFEDLKQKYLATKADLELQYAGAIFSVLGAEAI